MYERSQDKDDFSMFQIIDFSKVLYSIEELSKIIEVKEKGVNFKVKNTQS